ncbi:hypothetical protein Syun_017073 [Stephania yunnanensis]|uniref:Protein kinase domain-containing protein n=1 Tax=Stephania yunnanensis TaxID=152371 RepID=A0AAP0P5H5_9MAGN
MAHGTQWVKDLTGMRDRASPSGDPGIGGRHSTAKGYDICYSLGYIDFDIHPTWEKEKHFQSLLELTLQIVVTVHMRISDRGRVLQRLEDRTIKEGNQGLSPCFSPGDLGDGVDEEGEEDDGGEEDEMGLGNHRISGAAKKTCFDLEDLLRASAEVLEKGNVGTSYKTVLEEGTTVVVKRLKDVVVTKREFEVQMEGLGKVDHENIVPLRAFYYSKDEKLLVYDFMPAGSLSALLHVIGYGQFDSKYALRGGSNSEHGVPANQSMPRQRENIFGPIRNCHVASES